MKKLLMIAALFGQTAFCANATANSVYIAPAGGFEINLAAALNRKDVAVSVVTREEDAHFILQPSTVDISKESGVAQYARCKFAFCLGINDSGNVSVQLVEKETHRVVWAYEVAKQRAAWNRQSMAEAVAKHLQKDYFGKGW